MKAYLIASVALVVAQLAIPLEVASAQETAASETATSSSDEEAEAQRLFAIWRALKPQRGSVQLSGPGAVLHVPEEFAFFNQQDAGRILEDLWGNPPDDTVIGLIMPSQVTAFDEESWAAVISYEPMGYVPDDDADSIDYDELLVEMQQDTRDGNEERTKQGYPAIELIGWAQPPFYDKAEKKLHWAKLLQFQGGEGRTLNYNVRVLGRRGVLVINFIAAADQLPTIRKEVPKIMALANFNQGSRYADFDPDIDEVAAVGIGGLIAGKVLAKAGVFAALLAFGKKFIAIIALGIAAALAKLPAMFRRKKQSAEEAN